MKAPVIRFGEVPPGWLDSIPPEALASLEPWESERVERHRTATARAAYVRAHLLARECLAELAGQPVRFLQRCDGCGGTDHGAPYVVGSDSLYLSLSHSGPHVAAMAAMVPCGIDVQRVGRVPDRALTNAEAVSVTDDLGRSRLWARKEALIKAGVATMGDLGTLEVHEDDSRLHDWRPDPPALGECPAVVGAWALVP